MIYFSVGVTGKFRNKSVLCYLFLSLNLKIFRLIMAEDISHSIAYLNSVVNLAILVLRVPV